MKARLIIIIFVLFTLGSCVPKTVTKGSYIKLGNNISDAIKIEPSNVIVFYKKQPDFEFTEIGIVEGIAIGNKAGLKDLVPELQRQASMMGGTAIYKIEIQRHNQTGNALHATAIAIIRK